jgi:Response regulator of the LytR/AlgR family
MKISIDENIKYGDIEIDIKCPMITEQIEEIIAQLSLYNNTIIGKLDGSQHILKFSEILYFDTTDKKTFIYTDGKVYETPLRLYQLEEKIVGMSFIKVSKSAILNLKRVKIIDTKLNGKLIATLTNDEKIEISRMYVPVLKEKLGI